MVTRIRRYHATNMPIASCPTARHLDSVVTVPTKLCLLLLLLVACSESDDWYRFQWAFNCPDGTWFICRDEGYFHCESGPPIYNPGPACTFVSKLCSSNPRDGQSEAEAACALPCAALTTEPDCLARPDCEPIYNGIDCMNPSGSMCHGGDTDCMCAEYVFASCSGP